MINTQKTSSELQENEGMDKKEIRNLGLKLGACAGSIAIVYFFALYLTGAKLLDPFFKFDLWITLPFILVGLVYVRKAANRLKIWQGLVLGFYITIACAAIISIFYYVFLMYVDTDFIQQGEQARLLLIQSFIDKYQKMADIKSVEYYSDIYKTTKQLVESKKNTPLTFAQDKLFWQYLTGGVFTLITSILFRK